MEEIAKLKNQIKKLRIKCYGKNQNDQIPKNKKAYNP